MGRQIDLVDHQEVGARDARASLARNLLALGDVDDVDRRVDQLGAERGRQVVAAALDQQKLERGKFLLELAHRLEVGRRVLPDRRVRTSARLDPDDPVRRQRTPPHEELGVLLRVDVVGDDRHVEPGREPAAERLGQRGLPGADGAADADLQRTRRRVHERNSLASSVA